jgi:hypothetical protein
MSDIDVKRFEHVSFITKNNEALTCSHYEKKCSRFYFSCCNTIDPCARCHEERGCSHTPPRVSTITCNECNLQQPPSATCQNDNCRVSFGTSYCQMCVLWTSHPRISHCTKCNLCRIGTEVSVQHCDVCDICYAVPPDHRPHVCLTTTIRTKIKEQKCPVCLETLYRSQDR